jgi:hypothetical protein
MIKRRQIFALFVLSSLLFCQSLSYSSSASGLATGAVEENSEVLFSRVRVKPRWLDNIPTRNFQGWLDEDKGIYLATRGSVIGPHGSLKNINGARPSWLPRSLRDSSEQLHSHHLIENRFSAILGYSPDDMPAVLMTRSQHTGRDGIHSQIQAILPRGHRGSGSLTEYYRSRLAQIQQAYQRVYAGQDDWLGAISALMEDWHQRN